MQKTMKYKDGHPRTARNAWFCVELEDEKIAFVMPGHYFFCAFSNASGVPSVPVVIGSCVFHLLPVLC